MAPPPKPPAPLGPPPPPGPLPPRYPAYPDHMDDARWLDACKKASVHQLDAVHYSWERKADPAKMTAPCQFLWWCPRDILNAERNDKRQREGWRGLPLGRRARMLQLEAEEKQARRRGEHTQAFAVSIELSRSDDGETKLSVRARRIPWLGIWQIIKAGWKTWGTAIAAAAWVGHWLLEHGRAWLPR